MSKPNLNPIEVIEMMKSNPAESLRTRMIRCLTKWKRKIDRFLFVTWILTILALIFVLYRVDFSKENSVDTMSNKECNCTTSIRRVLHGIKTANKVVYIKERPDDACDTFDCRLSSQVSKSINSSADPCDDFYDFACGHSQKNPFSIDAERMEMDLWNMFEARMFDDESREMELVKKLYKSCMNRTEIEAVGLKQFNEIIRKIGGWPIVEGEQWNETAYDWVESIRQMRDVGLAPNYLFSTSVELNFENSSMRSLTIRQPEFKELRNLPLNYSDLIYLSYYTGMVELTVACGAHFDSSTLHELTNLLAFERALANISLLNEEIRDYEAIFNPFSISELQNKYPYVPWMDYFCALLPTDVQITSDEVVIVRTPRYFDRLAEVLQKTSKRTIANYFAWRTLDESRRFLRDPNLEHIKFLGDSIDSVDCIEITTELLAPAIGALYMRKFPKDDDLKENVQNLVESVRSSFIEMLKNATWMDEDTKSVAVDKAKSTIARIGLLKELSNKTKLEEHYKSLALNRNEFFMNVLRVKKFNLDFSFRQLYKPVGNDDWLDYPIPAVAGAFNIPQKNAILITKQMLRGAFISTDRPNYMNYGAMGQIIGHEIAHGFDDVGKKLDKNGNLKDWWMPETKLKFLNKTKCIIEQYGNFTDPNTEMNVNGKLTQGENIADNIGLKSAYYAYTKWLEHNSDKPLPGLKQYTSKQMFWISAAQTWCSPNDDESSIYSLITSDVHSPKRFRVNGPMRNSKEFAMDFECAPGTPMHPIEKCEIW